jgi:uncharacterized glyoxalase superfamily protein PhnB
VIPARISGVFSVCTRVGWDRQWYEGLGWQSAREDDVFVPYPVGRMSFALWSLGSAAPNVAAVVAAEGRCSGTVLCLVVDSAEEVASILLAVDEAGGRVVVADHEVPFGRSGWFLDPAGTTWEVCWINGRSSDAPFAGARVPGALPADLVGVTIGTDDPSGLEKFYADGLGWADRRSQFADLPAMNLEGGTLIFAPVTTVPRQSSGPIPIIRPSGAGSIEAVVEQLVDVGATPVSVADELDGLSLVTWLVDPFGLCWELVA